MPNLMILDPVSLHITELLSLEDHENLCLLSKDHLTYYAPFRDLFTLLNAVFQGNEAKVSELLQQKPALMTMGRAWVDNVGRKFKFVTALTYAIWAADADMVRTIVECLPKDGSDDANKIRDHLIRQFISLKNNGLSYTKGGSRFTTKFFSSLDEVNACGHILFDIYERAQQRQVAESQISRFALDFYIDEDDFDAMQSCWLQLGRVFRDSPIHVIQNYNFIDEAYDDADDHDQLNAHAFFSRKQTILGNIGEISSIFI